MRNSANIRNMCAFFKLLTQNFLSLHECSQISPVLMRDRTNCGLLWTIRCALAHYPQQFQALQRRKLNVHFVLTKTKSTGRTILIFLLNCSFSSLTSTSTTMLSKDKSSASSRTDLMFLKIYA